MDKRIYDLQRALERARQHVGRCRAELARFDRTANIVDPYSDMVTGRARERLAEDLRKAELDAAWAEIALADSTSPAEQAHLSEGADECPSAS